MLNFRSILGELIGTMLLVIFGCGSVIVATLFNVYSGILQIALTWGIGVTLAIYATRHLSCAHLNPAVSIAMVVGKRMSPKNLPVYILSQFTGAFMGAAILYVLFSGSIASFETHHGIARGTVESIETAMMFGEFYPNPSAGPDVVVSMAGGVTAEAFGTFLLVLMIFFLTEGCNVGRPNDSLAPIFIGLTVTVIITLIGPLTQAGLNPARDFAPRLFSFFAGWGQAAFPDKYWGFLWVYILAPVAGAIGASLMFTRVVQPAMKSHSKCSC
jgi:glycerol uptake facilitator protein